MTILVAIDASSSFTSNDTWESVKKTVNEVVEHLSKHTDVVLVKFTTVLRFCTLEEFNNGWDYSSGDGGGTDFSKVLEVVDQYEKVLAITDGFIGYDIKSDKVALLIMPDPDSGIELPIVDFHCSNCGNERGVHRANKNECPIKGKKSSFSTTDKFVPDPSRPIRKRTI